jgi:hypothetical protein
LNHWPDWAAKVSAPKKGASAMNASNQNKGADRKLGVIPFIMPCKLKRPPVTARGFK